jgi:transposase
MGSAAGGESPGGAAQDRDRRDQLQENHKYLTVVVDHDTGRLVWAAAGNDKPTLAAFFELLGPQRCARITHVSADAAAWIARTVEQYCPHTISCADPFHVVKWATDALDQVWCQAWNTARRQTGGSHKDRRGRTASAGAAQGMKRARWALWKNPGNRTDHQRHKPAWIAKTDPRLYRAYLLKEGLRHVFAVGGQAGKEALQRWLSSAARCQIPEFVKLARTIRSEPSAIHASLDHGLSNALIESTNTKIRLLTRLAFGFRLSRRPDLARAPGPGWIPPQATQPDQHIDQKSPISTLPRAADVFWRLMGSCPQGTGLSTDVGWWVDFRR